MSRGVQEILLAARGVVRRGALQLVAALIAALDERGLRPFDDSWLEETQRRSAEYAAGEDQPIPWAEVKERARGSPGCASGRWDANGPRGISRRP